MKKYLVVFLVVLVIFVGLAAFFLRDDQTNHIDAAEKHRSQPVSDTQIDDQEVEIEWSRGVFRGQKLDIQLASQGEFAPWAGALFTQLQNVYLIDRTAKLWKLEGEKLTKVLIPQLDLGLINDGIDPKYRSTSGVRIHRAVYDQKRDSLLITHEYYDHENAGTSFRVSILDNFSKHINGPRPFDKEGWEVLYTSELIKPQNYVGASGGGGLCIENDTVYFAVGNYDQDGVLQKITGQPPAQNDDSSLGKVFKLSLTTRNTAQFIAKGFRNPQGLACAGKDLFSVEHGPQGGDEINLISNDGRTITNYGWPYQTYGAHYGTLEWPLEVQINNVVEPLWAFVPSIGPSNLIYFSPEAPSLFAGEIFVASMKARHIYRIVLDKTRQSVVLIEPIFIGERIRDIAHIGDKFYLLTDSSKLYEITAQSGGKTNLATAHIKLNACLGCHTYGANASQTSAPNLQNIFSRNIAGTDFAYSNSLSALSSSIWTEQELLKYLLKPQEYAIGTYKPNLIDLGIEISNIEQAVSSLAELERTKK